MNTCKRVALTVTIVLGALLGLWGTLQASDELSDLQSKIQRVIERTNFNRDISTDLEGSVIVIGPSGSGKSTVVNYVAKRPLISQQGIRGFNLETSDPLPNSNISHTVRCGTSLPYFWEDQEHKIRYGDYPGFDDPRGAIEEIVNAVSLYQTFITSLSFKVLIVISEAALTEPRSSRFLELLKKMTEVFGDNEQLKPGLSLVITKQRDIDYSQIFSTILAEGENSKNQYLDNARLKDLLQFIANNVSDRVCVLPYPHTTGKYSTEYHKHIIQSIHSSHFIQSPHVNLSVGADAKILMGQLVQKLNTEIKTYIISLCPLIERNCEALVDNRGNRTPQQIKIELSNRLFTLQNINATNPINFIQGLEQFLQEFSLKARAQEIKDKAKSIEFLKSIDGTLSYQTGEWKNGLSTLTNRMMGLAGAPESKEVQVINVGTYTPYAVKRWSEKKRNYAIWSKGYSQETDERIVTTFPVGSLIYGNWTPSGNKVVEAWIKIKTEKIETSRGEDEACHGL